MILFRILYIIDSTAAIIILCFFFTGLNDGSVSSFNMELWFGILTGLAIILIGSRLLKTNGYLAFANALLCVLAIPAILYGLFLLLVIFSGAKWN